ncbi:MAG: site-specific integrase [Chitinophagaceae bacterium]|jgi:site-specific recombinase XerD
MLEKSFGLFFFLKQPKNQKNGPRYVYLRITVDGVSKELSTKRLWTVERWNQSAGRAVGTKEDARSLNVFLETLCSKIYQAKVSLLEENKSVTAESLKNVVTGQGDDKRMLLGIFREHNKKMEGLVGVDYVYETLQRYHTTYDHTENFIRWKYNLDDFVINELDYEFVSEFAFWLKSIRHCGHNSTMKYIGNLKKVLLECIRKGWLRRDPFLDFKTTRKVVKISPLTQDELNRINNKEFSIERLDHVRDIFLFSCYTGLAYVDVKKLKRTNIVKGVDGGQWIITNRQKTDASTRLPLLPKALEIMEKYHCHERVVNQDYVLPVLTNQKMNSYLKEIADTCGITKNLTFHIARHTFATTVTLSNGVPLETVSKMLGHSSIKQTQHYAKLLDSKISDDMGRLRLKLETQIS